MLSVVIDLRELSSTRVRIKMLSVGFGLNRLYINMVCTEHTDQLMVGSALAHRPPTDNILILTRVLESSRKSITTRNHCSSSHEI
jgi:hypothetical protein